MAINYNQVSVATTATSIISSNTNEKVRTIKNIGSNAIFVGGDSSVTTSNGFPIDAGETLDVSDYTGEVFGIVAAGTEDANYIEEDFQ
jgi:hypothetical protein